MPGASEGGDATDAVATLLDRVAMVLGDLALPHVLIGGQAVNLHAERRFTFDLDITVIAGDAGLDPVRDRLVAEGLTFVQGQPNEAGGLLVFLRLHDPASGLGLDLQAADTAYEVEVVRRGQRLDPAQPLPSATPEDLVILKLIAGRPKDYRDIHELLALDSLDWAYVYRWAEAWGVAERLRAFRAARLSKTNLC